MKKSSKAKSPAIPRVDPYLEGLVAKLVDRLVGLEKKMDTVIAQTMARSSGGETVKVQAPQPSRRERTLYEAICADCSKVCEVPFKPTEDRPVYCKECWARRKSGAHSVKQGMPVLTPVVLPARPAGKQNVSQAAAPTAVSVSKTPKKAKKSSPAKKPKRKK